MWVSWTELRFGSKHLYPMSLYPVLSMYTFIPSLLYPMAYWIIYIRLYLYILYSFPFKEIKQKKHTLYTYSTADKYLTDCSYQLLHKSSRAEAMLPTWASAPWRLQWKHPDFQVSLRYIVRLLQKEKKTQQSFMCIFLYMSSTPPCNLLFHLFKYIRGTASWISQSIASVGMLLQNLALTLLLFPRFPRFICFWLVDKQKVWSHCDASLVHIISSRTSGICQETLSQQQHHQKIAGARMALKPYLLPAPSYICRLEAQFSAAPIGVKTSQRAIHVLNISSNFLRPYSYTWKRRGMLGF